MDTKIELIDMEMIAENIGGYIPRKIRKENLIRELLIKGASQKEIISKVKEEFGKGVSPNLIVKIRKSLEMPKSNAETYHKEVSHQLFKLFNEMREHLIERGSISTNLFINLVERYTDPELITKLMEEVNNE